MPHDSGRAPSFREGVTSTPDTKPKPPKERGYLDIVHETKRNIRTLKERSRTSETLDEGMSEELMRIRNHEFQADQPFTEVSEARKNYLAVAKHLSQLARRELTSEEIEEYLKSRETISLSIPIEEDGVVHLIDLRLHAPRISRGITERHPELSLPSVTLNSSPAFIKGRFIEIINELRKLGLRVNPKEIGKPRERQYK